MRSGPSLMGIEEEEDDLPSPPPDWPFQRYGHTVAARGDKVYLFGGRNDRHSCNSLFVFDTSTRRWARPRVEGQPPPERDGHTACVIGDGMYVFGGYEGNNGRFGLESE